MWANYRTATNLLLHACRLISCLDHVSPPALPPINALNFCWEFSYWQQVCPETEISEYVPSPRKPVELICPPVVTAAVPSQILIGPSPAPSPKCMN